MERAASAAGHFSGEQYQAMFEAAAPPRLILIVQGKGQAVLGFLVARQGGDEWELENIVVAEQAQRLGYGSRLLNRFLDEARQSGAHSLHLEVRESNHPARALYEKWGFVETGRRRSYYSDPGEDAVLYRFSFQKDHR